MPKAKLLHKRRITALDIQDRYVKCAQLQLSSRSWRVQRSAVKEIPAPENDDASNHVHIAHTIRTLLQEMDIYPPRNLVTCISGRDAAVRLLSLPPVTDKHMKNIEKMVRYELMGHLPMNVEQMSYDYQVLDRNADRTLVLTVAAKRSVIERHLKILSKAGISPDVVTTTSLTLLNAFVQRELEAMGRIGLVCLRNSSGDVVVCEDGRLIYTRSFTFHTDSGKEQIIREIHSSFDTYIKSRNRNSAEDPEENGYIEEIHLMTEDGTLPMGLTEDDLSQAVPGTSWQVLPMGDDLALGLALSGARTSSKPISRSLMRLNLRRQITQEARVSRKKALQARLAHMAPAMAIPILMAISGILWWQVQEVGKEIRSVREAQEVSRKRMGSMKQLTEQEKELQKQVAFVDWSADAYPMVSYRLYQIAQTIPDSLWLKEVSIPEQRMSKRKRYTTPPAISKLRVIGYAHKQEHIMEFLSALRQYPCFSDVKQESTSEVRMSGERVLQFQIGLVSHAGKTTPQLAKAGVDL